MYKTIVGTTIALLSAGANGSCGPDIVQDNGSTCGPGVAGILTREAFENISKGRHTVSTCHQKAFDMLTYDGLLAASSNPVFSSFANVGDCTTRKRELMAFLAHTSHETNGGWAGAACGDKSYGFCFVEEVICLPGGDSYPCNQHYCDPTAYCMENYGVPCPCTSSKSYHGRGPIQISWNYNYAAFSDFMYGDDRVLRNPDMVLEDPETAWGSGLWFWLYPQGKKPSAHAVMTGQWNYDSTWYRGGFGAVTHIINGGLECGCEHGSGLQFDKVVSRKEFFKRYMKISGLPAGNLCKDPSGDSLMCRGMAVEFASPPRCDLPTSDSCLEDNNGQLPPQTSTSAPVVTTTRTVPPVTTAPTVPVVTTAPIASTTRPTTASSTTANNGGGSGGCVHETNCDNSRWCNDPSYVSYCPQFAPADCTMEMCKVDNGNDLAPTAAPTAAPTPPPAGGAACVQQKDCSLAPGHCEADYEQWCRDQNAHMSTHCPTPHCKWADSHLGRTLRAWKPRH